MINLKQESTRLQSRLDRRMGLGVAMAMLAALSYLLIQMGILGVGDLKQEDAPAAIVYICAGSYFVGGLLILLHRRWLWTIGAGINALVILFFLMAYQNRPSVLFSPGGLFTKLAQLLLEAVLIYLIVNFRSGSRIAVFGNKKHSGPSSRPLV